MDTSERILAFEEIVLRETLPLFEEHGFSGPAYERPGLLGRAVYSCEHYVIEFVYDVRDEWVDCYLAVRPEAESQSIWKRNPQGRSVRVELHALLKAIEVEWSSLMRFQQLNPESRITALVREYLEMFRAAPQLLDCDTQVGKLMDELGQKATWL